MVIYLFKGTIEGQRYIVVVNSKTLVFNFLYALDVDDVPVADVFEDTQLTIDNMFLLCISILQYFPYKHSSALTQLRLREIIGPKRVLAAF